MPKKVAIAYEDVPVTYCELNQKINRLSHALLKMGIQKGGQDRGSSL